MRAALLCLSSLLPSAPAPPEKPPAAPPQDGAAAPAPYAHPDFWRFPDGDLARRQVAFIDDRLGLLRARRAPLTWRGPNGGLSGEQLWLDLAIADAEARRRPWLYL